MFAETPVVSFSAFPRQVGESPGEQILQKRGISDHRRHRSGVLRTEDDHRQLG
jgi:hypothetical protein